MMSSMKTVEINDENIKASEDQVIYGAAGGVKVAKLEEHEENGGISSNTSEKK